MKHYIEANNMKISLWLIIEYICLNTGLNYENYKVKAQYKVEIATGEIDYTKILKDIFKDKVDEDYIQYCIESLINECKHSYWESDQYDRAYLRRKITTENNELRLTYEKLNIDNYAIVVAKTDNRSFMSYPAIFNIKYSSNGIETNKFIDYETMINLCKNGYIAGYTAVYKDNYGYYVQRVDKKLMGKGFKESKTLSATDVINAFKNNKVIHATDVLEDRKLYKVNIDTLIFGDYNFLTKLIISYGNTKKKVSVQEYNAIAHRTVFSPIYFREIKIASDSYTIVDKYTREEVRAFADDGYRINFGNMFGVPKAVIYINDNLDYRTAKRFLGYKCNIQVEYSNTQNEYEQFITKISKYYKGIRKIHLNDNIVHVKTIRGVNGIKRGICDLYILYNKLTNEHILVDSSIVSSSIWRKMNHDNYETINTDYMLNVVNIDKTYNHDSQEYIITVNIDKNKYEKYMRKDKQ